MPGIKSFIRQRVFDIFRLSYYFKISYIRTRNEFPIILNRQKLTATGVEIGVWQGEFSAYLLEHWKGERLYSVDPWKTFFNAEYLDIMNIEQQEFDKNYRMAREALAPFNSRSQILKKTSQEAVDEFENNSLDFVYLDGRHQYDGIKEDISLWYPKVKPGGILGGHDYLNGVMNDTHFGVKQAVDEFIQTTGLKLFVTDKDKYPSWFVIKK